MNLGTHSHGYHEDWGKSGDTAVEGSSVCGRLHWLAVSAEDFVLLQGECDKLGAVLEMGWLNSEPRTAAGFIQHLQASADPLKLLVLQQAQ